MNNDPLINLNRLRNATTEAERIEIRSILSVEERKVLEEQRKERRQHKRKNSLEENQTTSKKQKGDYKRCPFCDEEMVNNVSYMMFHVANCLQLEKKKNNKENVDPQKEWPLTEGRDYMNPKRDKDKEKKGKVDRSCIINLKNRENCVKPSSSIEGIRINDKELGRICTLDHFLEEINRIQVEKFIQTSIPEHLQNTTTTTTTTTSIVIDSTVNINNNNNTNNNNNNINTNNNNTPTANTNYKCFDGN